ncbi:hypothetical protein QAD02_016307 [Eretmocerus hayati]|uniref:Uncharacterized protein n=1 Tax=Eretmocerus hayati TaxID=131215 RepID=A0ACC2PFI1_9HYME|nr:hypothetical protein QAD02_016307 [Eretmocerus hayati]
MGKLKSTIPGMPYPSARNNLNKNAFNFLEGRRKDDNAEGLWRIADSLYDLNEFVKKHPGGSEWISMTKGTDITEAFEAHHLSDRAEKMLPKYYVRKAIAPRSLPYTFEPNGFYRKFKQRAREALKNVDYHQPSAQSKRLADFIATITILSVIAVAITKSWIFVVISGVFLAWTTIIAHNFFHMRDNFRMYYFDLSIMSSKEWRVSHALSHHLYPNTLWDMEVYMFEPFIDYLPTANKSLIYKAISLSISPIVMWLASTFQGIKRYYSIIVEWKKLEIRDLVPFLLPVTMSFFTPSIFDAIKLWLCIIMISGTVFHFVGLNAAHHHPEIFHDGDVCREDLDWGLMELDAVRDRKVIDDSLFLVLTNFGSHGMHHLLPTVDHANLELCLPAFYETCREFGVDSEKLSQWQLIKGQYAQLLRSEPRLNARGKTDGGPIR